MKLLFTNCSFRNIFLLLLTMLFEYSTLHAQCPADPIGCIPSTTVSSMPDTAFICEGVTSLLLDPKISGGNFNWFREDKNNLGIYNAAGNSSSLANITVEANYYVCHQQNNTGCYIKDKVVVVKKSLADQLEREREFDTKNPNPLFICSGQAKPFFNTAGNTAKYSYSWFPSSLFVGAANIKNSKFTATYPKGALSTGSFDPTLSITEKSTRCIASKKMRTNTYPPPNPDFGNLQFCQNTSSEISARVFVVYNYTIKSATLQIGSNPIINLNKTDFTKISSSQLFPNTLGEVSPPNTIGRQLNSPSILVDVAKIPMNTSQTGANIPITFTMVTDSGCTATVSSTYTVTPTVIYNLEISNTSQTRFCSNDVKVGPLTAKDASGNLSKGLFSGPGVLLDQSGTYYFNPPFASKGLNNITFAPSEQKCYSGNTLMLTVKQAPKPMLVGRQNVCLGSLGIEYRDTAFHTNTATRLPWKILNGNSTPAVGISFVAYGVGGDSIKVNFPNPYTEINKKAFIVATNDDGGCIASDTLEVSINEFNKTPFPLGPSLVCLNNSNTISYQYTSSSLRSNNLFYKWDVMGGKITNTNKNDYQVDVIWDVNAPLRTIAVTEESITYDLCNIQSDKMIVNFTNAIPAPLISLDGDQLKSNYTNGNEWYFNGQPIKDSTNQFITPNSNGTYSAKYINGECTSSMSEPYNFVLGSEDGFIANNSLQIFPNPTNSLLHIQVPFTVEKIVVYQSNGKLALETKASESIDVTSLSEGLYLLEVWNREGIRVVKKFEKR